MEKQDQHILGELAARVREQFPQAKILAFGSRVRGDFREDSDFDVCVILERCRRQDKKTLRRIAWEVAFEHGQVFNLLIFTDGEFEKGPLSESSLVHNIRQQNIPA